MKSRALLDEHRQIWDRKPVLEVVYSQWFGDLLKAIPPESRVFEIGAGPGFLSAYARRHRADLRWVAADIIPTPWNDLAGDAHQLPLKDASFDAIVGLDVLHHLSHPMEFLAETARVLRRGGQLSLLEPWITPLSYPVYRLFHHERCSLGVDPLSPFADTSVGAKDPFEGDAAVPWRLVGKTSADSWRSLGLKAPRVKYYNGFAYILSLGFRSSSLLPRCVAPPITWVDGHTAFMSRLVGMRALVTWTRMKQRENHDGLG